MLRKEAKSDQQRRLMSKITKTNTTVLLGDDCITGRGFGLVNFQDDNGKECSIQISSCTVCETEDCIIDNPRGWIWLGIDKAEPIILKTKGCELGLSLPPGEVSGWMPYPVPDDVFINTRMHLNEAQVRGLIVRLQTWLDTGDFRAEPNKKGAL